MKTNQTSKIIAGLIALFTMVGFFTMFAPAFASSPSASVNGNIFAVTFGNSDRNIPVIPLFIVAFSLLIAAFLFSFGGFILSKKNAILLYGIEFVFTLAVGVIFLFGVQIFDGVHGANTLENLNEAGLGAGSICVIVFSFISAALALIGCYSNREIKD
jgi:hypothetical protein